MAWVPDDVPLLVFVDCLVLLAILARWGQEDFWPDADEIKHFDIIEACLRRLRCRSAVTRLVKVKSHSGILMNERADDLADQGCASEDEPRWPGPRKLDPLQLCPRESIRTGYAPFPDCFVCDKQLVRRASEGTEWVAAQTRNTTFSREMLQDPANCSAILMTIPSQPDSMVRLWMQAVSGLYPTMARLHRIFPNKFRSANCTWCGANVPETLCHFVSVCTRFHDARTAAHNRAWQNIVVDLKRVMLPSWKFFVETTAGDTGLLNNPLTRGSRSHASQTGIDLELFRNLRPDAFVINRSQKKIAIMDFTRPYDGCDGQDEQASLATQPDDEVSSGRSPPRAVEGDGRGLGPSNEQARTHRATVENTPGRIRIVAAAQRKRETYSELAKAIRLIQGTSEWQVEVLPWVAGSRGVVDAPGLNSALEFLEVPAHRRRKIMQRTALESFRSFEYMHRVRTSANPRALLEAGVPLTVDLGGRKRQRGVEDAHSTLQRWKRLAIDPMRANLQSARWRGDHTRS